MKTQIQPKKHLFDVTFKQIELSDWQIREELVKALSGEKTCKETLENLAVKMFPKDDLPRQVKLRQINKEVEAFRKEMNNAFYVSDDYDEEDVYRLTLEFSVDKFIEHHEKMKEIATYLANKYQVNIEFYYQMWQYTEPQKEDDPEKVISEAERPRFIGNFDIDLED